MSEYKVKTTIERISKTGTAMVIFWIVVVVIFIIGKNNVRKSFTENPTPNQPTVNAPTPRTPNSQRPVPGDQIAVDVQPVPEPKRNPLLPPPKFSVQTIAKYDANVKKTLDAANGFLGLAADHNAQFEIGAMYDFGLHGVSKHDGHAAYWYRKAAEGKHILAINNLGGFYEYGRGGLPKDDQQAVMLYRIAANSGNDYAQHNLGLMYEQGRGGLPKDEKEARKWIQKAFDQGHQRSIDYMAKLKAEEAAKEAQRKAEARIKGQERLASMMAARKRRQEQARIKALEEKEAKWQALVDKGERGDRAAQLKLAREYSSQKNYPLAVNWYRKAGEQGDRRAQSELGLFFLTGREDVPKNDDLAFKWLLKAAQQGDAYSQSFIADFYAEGKGGVEKDETLALTWTKKAASGGQYVSQLVMGRAYIDGLFGSPIDSMMAKRWYAVAMNPTNATSLEQLQAFIRMINARDLPESEAQPSEWYLKALSTVNTNQWLEIDWNDVSKEQQHLEALRKKASEGNSAAQVELAELYFEGSGGAQKDKDQAMIWYRKAADQGNADAAYRIATHKFWALGNSGEQENEILKWHRKAASLGHPKAQQALGLAHQLGMGSLQTNYTMAIKWYALGINPTNAASQEKLQGLVRWLNEKKLPESDAPPSEWYLKALSTVNTNRWLEIDWNAGK